MTRRNVEELDDPAWRALPPEGQELSLQECLQAHTVNAAHQVHMDGKIGQLIPGAYADIAVFERDMFELEPEEILDDSVTMTIFNGTIVYQK